MSGRPGVFGRLGKVTGLRHALGGKKMKGNPESWILLGRKKKVRRPMAK